jgi:hypothetical protein
MERISWEEIETASDELFRTLHNPPSRGNILASYELPECSLLHTPSGTGFNQNNALISL